MEKKRGSKFFKMKKNLGKEKPHSWEWTGKPQKKTPKQVYKVQGSFGEKKTNKNTSTKR